MRSLKTEERKVFHLHGYVAVEKVPGVFKVQGNDREFTLQRLRGCRWKASGRSSNDSQKKGYQRLSVQAEDLCDAVLKAEQRLFPDIACLDGANLEIADVLAKWIATRSVSAWTERVYRDGIKRFLDWVQVRGCLRWSELSRGLLQEYLGTLKDYRANYKKNLWKPIRGASLWASLEWPNHYRDIAARIQIQDTALQYPDDKVSLSLTEAAEFCLSLQDSDEGRRVLPGVALQVLAGLRLTEAFRLEWESVDFDSGIVTVQGQVKGRESVRRIPVADFVLDILSELDPTEGRLLAEYSEHGNYAKAVARSLKRWNSSLKLEPKGLRRTLETEAALRGWSGYAFNRYLGRAPGSIPGTPGAVAERHYIAVGTKLVDMLRSQVTERINEVLEPFRDLDGPSASNVIQLRVV